MKYILTENSVSFVVNSSSFSIPRQDEKFHKSIGIIYDPAFSEAEKNQALLELVDDKFFVTSHLNLCPVIISQDKNRYGTISYSSLRSFLPFISKNNIPLDVVEKFVNNLCSIQNSSSLLNWIVSNKILLSSDGHLFLYKGLRENLTDCFSGTIRNYVGMTNEMAEETITKCHGGPGFYFGNFDRAKSMSRGKMVLVRVLLNDIVWFDCNEMKVKKYKVVKEEYSNLPVGAYDFDCDDWVEPVAVPEPKRAFRAISGLRRLGLRRHSRA